VPTEYEFRETDVPITTKHPTKWMVREVRDGRPFGNWKRLHCTPRGTFYLKNRRGVRYSYDGPAPEQ
jgi:hypothetical protein